MVYVTDIYQGGYKLNKWTDIISERTLNLKQTDLPNAAYLQAKRAFIDTLGCIYASKEEPVIKKLEDYISSIDSPLKLNNKGYYESSNIEYSALILGTMAHAIDFDDVNAATHGHPSAVLMPTAMVVAEYTDSTFEEMYLAYIAGFEVMSLVGETLGFDHYEKGWHSSSTYGIIGATVVASKLIGLDIDQISKALAIAVSQIGGSRRNFGTMMKPFHIGNACRIAVSSVLLANKGFTSADNIIEEKMGYFDLYQGKNGLTNTTNKLINLYAEDNLYILHPGIDVKKYPCCYWTARGADGVLNIIENEKMDFHDIKKIQIITPTGGLNALIYTNPRTDLEGKFSMEFVLASAAYYKSVGFQNFSNESLSNQEIKTLMQLVEKSENPEIDVREGANGGHVVVKIITEHNTFEEHVKYPRGSAYNPLLKDELLNKFTECIKYSNSNEIDGVSTFNKIWDLPNEFLYRSWQTEIETGVTK